MGTATDVRSLTMTSLMNESVRNRQGEDLGRIEDYVVDVETGLIQYGLLGFGGFLGMGEHRVAVPYTALQFDAQRGFILDSTRERLQQAPPFDAGRAGGGEGGTYTREIHDFWSVEYPAGSARHEMTSGEPEQSTQPRQQRTGQTVRPGRREDDYYKPGSGSTDSYGEGTGGTAGGYPGTGGGYYATSEMDPAAEEEAPHNYASGSVTSRTRGSETVPDEDDADMAGTDWGLGGVTAGTSADGGMGRGSDVMGDYSPSGGSVTDEDRQRDENG